MNHRGTTPRPGRRPGRTSHSERTIRVERVTRAGRIATVVATLGMILVVVTAPPAAACSCMSSSVADQLDRADVVFTGTVVAPTGDIEPEGGPIDVTFRVERSYKGTVDAEPVVETTSSGASCGLDTPISGPYLVFAHENAGGLVDAGLCSGTRRLSGDVPQELGPGTVVPTAGAASAAKAATAESSDRLIAGSVVALSVLVVAGLLVMTQRQRRRAASEPTPPPSGLHRGPRE